jgi:hypothetical protein
MEVFSMVLLILVLSVQLGAAADIEEGEQVPQCRDAGNRMLIQRGRVEQAQDASQANHGLFLDASEEQRVRDSEGMASKLPNLAHAFSDATPKLSPRAYELANGSAASSASLAPSLVFVLAGRQSSTKEHRVPSEFIGTLNGSSYNTQLSSPNIPNSSAMSSNNSVTGGVPKVSLLAASVDTLNGSSDNVTQLLIHNSSQNPTNSSATGDATKVSLLVILLPLAIGVVCAFLIACLRCSNLRSTHSGPHSGSRAHIMPPYRLGLRSASSDSDSFPAPRDADAATRKDVQYSNSATRSGTDGASDRSAPAEVPSVKLASFGPLCAELVGPTRNESIIALPSLVAVASKGSALDRAPLEKAAETSICERMIKSKTGLDIVKVIVTHMADWQRISLLAAKTQKLLGFCEFKPVVNGDPFKSWIYRSNGECLAVLEQKSIGPVHGQEAAIDPSVYFLTTFTAVSTTYQIEGDVARRRLKVTDCIRKEEAMSVEPGGAFEFQQDSNEYYRLRVKPKADAGVIILTLFAIDRASITN